MYSDCEKYPDLWEYLKKTDKKIVLYGMGNGADKILSVAERHGIEICDFFASDGFVRGHEFHGKRVMSYSEVKDKYGADNIIVLLSFASSLPDVLQNIYKIADECELYAPDVPVYGDEIFNFEFYRENLDAINRARALFCDDESRRIYDNIIRYKLYGNISYLRCAESDPDEAYRAILRADEIESYADLGAYNGDSIRALMPYAENLKRVVALEPDRRNFRKLCEWASGADVEIEAHNLGAWSGEETLYFDGSGNRNASMAQNVSLFSDTLNARAKKIVEVKANSLDNILNGAVVDYIKYDVEGSEHEALIGSAKTIKACSPRLLVSLYHRSRDIFMLPIFINEMNPDYKLYLRRFAYVPAWDINLYAT